MLNRLLCLFSCVLLAITVGAFSAQPSVSSASVASVRDFGAVGDGKTLDTAAIQKAVDAVAARGGGMVIVPAGSFLSGPIFLKSNITFHLSSGAVLLGSKNLSDYPVIEGRWEGIERQIRSSLITGKDLENVAITGNGTLDGQGSVWWGDDKNAKLTEEQKKTARELRTKYPRPRMINLINCKHVLIRDIKLMNSPSWTVHPVYCEDLTVDGITIQNPSNSPNTDGLDPDSCKSVRISNCLFSCGDDCITLKSGKDEAGRKVGRATEDVTITNCVMRSGHGGVVIGSEMSGGVHNVSVSNCVFVGTQRGIRIKSQRGRGGAVENISFDNITMKNIKEEAISITQFYSGTKDAHEMQPVNDGTPVFRNISMSNIHVDGAGTAADLEGIPEMPLTGISLSNFSGQTKAGMSCLNADGIDIRDFRLTVQKGTPITCETSSRVRISNADLSGPSDVSLIDFKDVRNGWITGCPSSSSANTFLTVEGEKSSGIVLSGNHPDIVKVLASDVPANAVRLEK